MKNFVKVLWLVMIGLIVAVIVYPFLHELGHTLMSVLLGGRVTELTLLPLPSVVTASEQGNMVSVVLIGWSGIMLPAAVASLCRPHRFCLWYGVFVLRCISLWSFVLAMISAVCYKVGQPLQNDDITTLLSLCPNGEAGVLLFASAGAIWMLFMLYRARPKMHCYAYFSIVTHF